MRYYPEDESDKEDVEQLNAESWMIESLKMNPGYCSWGPYEDYMWKENEGWDSRVIIANWEDFDWQLNELNEVVNFYFEVTRDSKPCEHCDQSGYNPETKRIADDWYDFAGTGREWCHNITQDEVDALVENKRLWDFKGKNPTADEVNQWSQKGIGHDAINRMICVEQRAKRLGVYGQCEHCEGYGHIYTEDKGKLGLVLWVLHPRKGCSRGIHIKEIQKHELTSAVNYLLHAAERNQNRFSKLTHSELN